jgi:catechol 2,3-dioxygenase-like lactoylglutathione lyase family enzyme
VTQPVMQVGALTIAAAHPRELAQFYAAMLGWEVVALEGPRPGRPPADGWAQIRPPAGESGPTLNFETDVNYRRPVWPSTDGEQFATQHLDIGVEDLPAAVAWAKEQGATEAEFQPQEHVRVMIDPDGHPFCLC